MGREVRPVALDWEHPLAGGTYSDGSPRYIGLNSREDLRFRLEWNAEHPDHEDAQEPQPNLRSQFESARYADCPATGLAQMASLTQVAPEVLVHLVAVS